VGSCGWKGRDGNVESGFQWLFRLFRSFLCLVFILSFFNILYFYFQQNFNTILSPTLAINKNHKKKIDLKYKQKLL
jgi:hypothetical protein